MKRYGVIVAARLGSSRLPGKALLPLTGLPMIVFLLRRIRTSQRIEQIVLATTTLPEDDRLAEVVAAEGIPVFRGAQDNVVKRFVEAARAYNMDYVVRITGDCPFVDGASLDYCLAQCDGAADFVIATTKGRFPVGIDYEIYRAESMAQLDRESLTDDEREHLTLPIYNRLERFPLLQLMPPAHWPVTHRAFTVDTAVDYHFASSLSAAMPAPTTDIATLLAISAQLPLSGQP